MHAIIQECPALDTPLIHEFLADYRAGKALGFLEPLALYLDTENMIEVSRELENSFDGAPEFEGHEVAEVWNQIAPQIPVAKASVTEFYFNARTPLERALSLCLMSLYE